MEFRYTEKIGYVIAIVSIIAPFYVSIRAEWFTGYTSIFIMGPFWQLTLNGSEIENFAMNPFMSLLYLPFWGWGLYIAKITVDEARLQEKTRYEYVIRVIRILMIHMIVLIIFTLMNSGMPEPLDFPIPAAGILALLLTPLTINPQEEIWEDQDAFGEEEVNQ